MTMVLETATTRALLELTAEMPDVEPAPIVSPPRDRVATRNVLFDSGTSP